jgi:IPT/TIG domain
VTSTTRTDATKLQARLEINPTAQPSSVTLYVSNPAGAAAETSFTILPATAQPAPPTPAPAPPAPGQQGIAPLVTSVEPARLAPGSRTTLKIKGKDFVDGASVSFSNPGIQVVATRFVKSKEIEVDVAIAPDAATGSGSLFVVNPDQSEVEHPFEVAAGNPTTTLPATGSTATSTTTATPAKGKAAGNEQTFDVYNLGDAKTIFQNPTQAKGSLILAGKELRYEEGGKVVFSAAASEVQEIAPNIVFGINTATFHVILRSSKTYNFVSASLRPADTQAIVDKLRSALQ